MIDLSEVVIPRYVERRALTVFYVAILGWKVATGDCKFIRYTAAILMVRRIYFNLSFHQSRPATPSLEDDCLSWTNNSWPSNIRTFYSALTEKTRQLIKVYHKKILIQSQQEGLKTQDVICRLGRANAKLQF